MNALVAFVIVTAFFIAGDILANDSLGIQTLIALLG